MPKKQINYGRPNRLGTEGFDLNLNLFSDELEQAGYALGLLEGSQKKLHNPDLLVSPLTAKEAAVSSKIEGTQSTVSDVFIDAAGGATKHSDVRQVANYRRAILKARTHLSSGRPLNIHLIRSLHRILLTGVRHKGTPGKFRDIDVWIAEKEWDPIEKAIYVPPEPFLVEEYMDDLMKYINQGPDNTLIIAGLSHYQFEAVHPFQDGNGRIGRLLIPLVLHLKKKVSQPILYMSGYFEENRDEYVRRLHDVDETSHYEPWLKFYLKSVANQINETMKIIDSIYDLYGDIKNNSDLVKSPYLIPFLDYVFESPMFTISDAMDHLGTSSRMTIVRLLKEKRSGPGSDTE